MKKEVRVLGIAPYDGMKSLMMQIVEEFPEITLTAFVGDLSHGAELAARNFHENYDVVISRGATAQLLYSLPIPVVRVEITMYDIMTTIKLAGCGKGKTAVVTFADIASTVRKLCDVLGYDMDVYTAGSFEGINNTLRVVSKQKYDAILCDVVVNTAAQAMGLNSFLICSSEDSIRKAFSESIALFQNVQRLKQENVFFRELTRGQISHTLVLSPAGDLFFSSTENISSKVLELFRGEIGETMLEGARRITRCLNKTIYTIQAKCISFGATTYFAFFYTTRKTSGDLMSEGIQFTSCAEARENFYNSSFYLAGIIKDLQDDLDLLSQGAFPVMLCGESGTGKKSAVDYLYINGSYRQNPLISIECNMMSEKSWAFLTGHYSSPLADNGCTLYFSNIDSLSDSKRSELVNMIDEMDVCRRNRVIFSCVSNPGEGITALGRIFSEHLRCVTFQMLPLRLQKGKLPALINITLNRLNMELTRQIVGIDEGGIELLQKFDWPHNLNQFQRIMQQLAATAAQPIISVREVADVLRAETVSGVFTPVESSYIPIDLNRSLRSIEQEIALRVIRECGGNQSAAAKKLGIGRTTLWRLVQHE